jgi:predicted nucleic acid-binding protein
MLPLRRPDEAQRTILGSVKSFTWAIPWPCVHEFIAIVTHPRIFKTPTSLDLALRAVHVWGEGENLIMLSEQTGYLEKLHEIVVPAKVIGGRIHDAQVAALCLLYGVRELWTADRDFSIFPKLKIRNPLVSGQT